MTFGWGEKMRKMKYAARNIMISLYWVSLSVHWLSLRLFLLAFLLCLSPPVFHCLLLCVSACLSEQQSTLWYPQSAFKFYTTLLPATQSVWAKLLWFTPAHNQDSILQRLLLHCKREHKLSITYLLLLDKGGHVNRGNEAVQELRLPGGTWLRCWG